MYVGGELKASVAEEVCTEERFGISNALGKEFRPEPGSKSPAVWCWPVTRRNFLGSILVLLRRVGAYGYLYGDFISCGQRLLVLSGHVCCNDGVGRGPPYSPKTSLPARHMLGP